MHGQFQLEVTTPSDLEIVMTREFAASRHLVWEAMIKPDLLRRWLFCPPGWAMTRCEIDPRVGGEIYYEWSGPDGKVALTIWGVFREVTPFERIVHTERMSMGDAGCRTGGTESSPLEELLATLQLTETAGGTLLKMTLLFGSKPARDGALASGMEHGVAAGYNTLDGILGR